MQSIPPWTMWRSYSAETDASNEDWTMGQRSDGKYMCRNSRLFGRFEVRKGNCFTPPPPVPGTAPGRAPWPSPRPPWRRGRRDRPGTRPRPEAAGGRLWATHGQRSRPWAWHWPGRCAGRPPGMESGNNRAHPGSRWREVQAESPHNRPHKSISMLFLGGNGRSASAQKSEKAAFSLGKPPLLNWSGRGDSNP